MTGPRPMPMPMPPGWYPDPQGMHCMRWFDGRSWTAGTMPMPVQGQPLQSPLVPIMGAVSAVAGLVVVLGSFMSWASTAFASRSGIDGGDGWITLAIGVFMAGVGLAITVRAGVLGNGIANVVLGLAAAGIAIYEMSDVSGRSPFISIGTGLYLILAAAVIGAACAGTAASQA